MILPAFGVQVRLSYPEIGICKAAPDFGLPSGSKFVSSMSPSSKLRKRRLCRGLYRALLQGILKEILGVWAWLTSTLEFIPGPLDPP